MEQNYFVFEIAKEKGIWNKKNIHSLINIICQSMLWNKILNQSNSSQNLLPGYPVSILQAIDS